MTAQGETRSLDQVRVRILPDGRMKRDNAARYLGHQPKTLAMWQLQGKGPRSVKVGGRVFYYREDLEPLHPRRSRLKGSKNCGPWGG